MFAAAIKDEILPSLVQLNTVTQKLKFNPDNSDEGVRSKVYVRFLIASVAESMTNGRCNWTINTSDAIEICPRSRGNRASPRFPNYARRPSPETATRTAIRNKPINTFRIRVTPPVCGERCIIYCPLNRLGWFNDAEWKPMERFDLFAPKHDCSTDSDLRTNEKFRNF